MGRIIRRTVTITISESWTIVWTDEPADDLSATDGESGGSILSQQEQTNAKQINLHDLHCERPAGGADHDDLRADPASEEDEARGCWNSCVNDPLLPDN